MEIRPKAEWLGEGVGRWPRRPGREREARDGQRPKATPHGVTWAPLPAVACAVGPAITSLFRPAQPDRPWCAPDQLPPDARRAADGKPAPSCLCLRGVFGGCLLSMHSFVLRHDLPESCVAYTTLICRTWGYAALLRETTFRRQKRTSRTQPGSRPHSSVRGHPFWVRSEDFKRSCIIAPTARLCGSPKATGTPTTPG